MSFRSIIKNVWSSKHLKCNSDSAINNVCEYSINRLFKAKKNRIAIFLASNHRDVYIDTLKIPKADLKFRKSRKWF